MMKYTLEDIRKALVPVIGEGEAANKILDSLVPDTRYAFVDHSDVEINRIVVDSHDTLYRVIHISERGLCKCKSWDGNTVVDYGPADIRSATHKERLEYYKKQVEFLRINVAPFLNYFSMRQLNSQIKEDTAKASLDTQLNTIEQNCLLKIQDIKKLW